jgi:hypothetical protein
MPQAGGTCQPFTFAGVNASCGIDLASFNYVQCTNADCVAGTGQPQGTCTTYLADGDSCSETGGTSCQIPASCKGGKCVINDPGACK